MGEAGQTDGTRARSSERKSERAAELRSGASAELGESGKLQQRLDPKPLKGDVLQRMLRVDGRLQGGGNDVEIGRWTTDKASGERAQVGVVG